ncbi:MAG: hypothetical protein WB014_11130 [Methanosarcina sp.]
MREGKRGRGNAAGILKIIDSIIEDEKWSWYLRDFVFPYGFYGPEEYREWLKNAGYSKTPENELKRYGSCGKRKLASMASTWHPFTQKVREMLRNKFIDELVDLFVSFRSPDN